VSKRFAGDRDDTSHAQGAGLGVEECNLENNPTDGSADCTRERFHPNHQGY